MDEVDPALQHRSVLRANQVVAVPKEGATVRDPRRDPLVGDLLASRIRSSTSSAERRACSARRNASIAGADVSPLAKIGRPAKRPCAGTPAPARAPATARKIGAETAWSRARARPC
jgi:hypothetical protein